MAKVRGAILVSWDRYVFEAVREYIVRKFRGNTASIVLEVCAVAGLIPVLLSCILRDNEAGSSWQ